MHSYLGVEAIHTVVSKGKAYQFCRFITPIARAQYIAITEQHTAWSCNRITYTTCIHIYVSSMGIHQITRVNTINNFLNGL